MKRNIYIFTSGELKREANTLVLIGSEAKRVIPVETVDSIYVFAEISFNKKLLEFLTWKRILLHVFNRQDYYVGTYYPREYMNSGYILLKQVKHFIDSKQRLILAKGFVYGAILNMLFVLRTYKSRGKEVGEQIEKLEIQLDNVGRCADIPSLMAVEGHVREIYYSAFDTITENPHFCFDIRTKRPPANRMNALISFGNSLLYVTVLSEIYRTNLDPRIGYLHETNHRSFTLNLDIAEVFKPLIVDRVIFQLINRGEIKAGDFTEELDGVYMKEKGMKTFIRAYENRLEETIRHKKLRRNVSYRRLIRLECYKLYKHFLGDEAYTPFVRTR